ncbi:NAD(P)H-hydrate dehydratase [Coralloluteibacterium thermophilus]|uniref:Bifunctional NAD(P)H-hydrate repair enzyme n=1 Tax=Coralloluteibacterium thermophilum TaxID=2707049 RepID=A0ABV9NLB1_9GAMM
MFRGQPLYRTADLRALERASRDVVAEPVLMQRAAAAAWRHLQARWPDAGRLLVVCGGGNNGGDGHLLAALAHAAGREATVLVPAGTQPRGEAAEAAWRAWDGPRRAFDGALPADADLIVDALFGIGLTRAPRDEAAALIAAMNAAGRPVLALDVPSGLDADTGAAPGAAVRADATVEFLLPKRGLRTGRGPALAGTVYCERLDLPDLLPELENAARCIAAPELGHWLAPRPRDAHKGDHGHVLAIGGDHGTGGALALCLRAALRSGAGLVSGLTRREHVPALLAQQPEIMAHAADAPDAAPDLLTRADVVAVGPGLGRGAWGRAWFARALAAGRPLVVDADALNLLAEAPRRLDDAVLTPHPGEAARLLGIGTAEVQADRFAAAAALAERYGSVVVLKGSGSLVAAPGRTPRVVAAGNPGMGSGGMGDVLTGVIAALRGQGLDAFEAASCGALLHAAAADLAAADGERGLAASDLLPTLRRLANP